MAAENSSLYPFRWCRNECSSGASKLDRIHMLMRDARVQYDGDHVEQRKTTSRRRYRRLCRSIPSPPSIP